MLVSFFEFHHHGIDVVTIAAQFVDMRVESPANKKSVVVDVVLTDHERERRVPQILARYISPGWRRGRCMDCGKPIGHSRTDEKRAVTAVRVTNEIDFVWINVAADRELPDKPI